MVKPLMILNVSYGNKNSEEWETVAEIPLKPMEERNGASPTVGGLQLDKSPVQIPDGETLLFTVSYSTSNSGLSVFVQHKEETLLHFGGFKLEENSWDPSAYFVTPSGKYVQIMVGPKESLRRPI